MYGWLKNASTVFVPNLSGIFVALFCIYSFDKHAIVKPKGKHDHLLSCGTLTIEMYVISSFIIGFSLLLGYMGLDQPIGSIGCVLSIIVSG